MATKNNLIDDLMVLTTVPHSTYTKLVEKSQYIICHTLEEALIQGQDTMEINIGIGILTIKIEEDNVKYRFYPTPSLNNNIKNTIVSGQSPLTTTVEELLKERLCNTYKELF